MYFNTRPDPWVDSTRGQLCLYFVKIEPVSTNMQTRAEEKLVGSWRLCP